MNPTRIGCEVISSMDFIGDSTEKFFRFVGRKSRFAGLLAGKLACVHCLSLS